MTVIDKSLCLGLVSLLLAIAGCGTPRPHRGRSDQAAASKGAPTGLSEAVQAYLKAVRTRDFDAIFAALSPKKQDIPREIRNRSREEFEAFLSRSVLWEACGKARMGELEVREGAWRGALRAGAGEVTTILPSKTAKGAGKLSLQWIRKGQGWRLVDARWFADGRAGPSPSAGASPTPEKLSLCLKYIKSGHTFGPVSLKEGSVITLGKSHLTLTDVTSGRFSLRAGQSGRVFGPFPIAHARNVMIGKGVFTILLGSE